MESLDDAGVYKLTDELALIQTVDFFTPIVDSPYDFGQIAAANALSDVYAMGGKPLTALNLACFPRNQMDISVLRDILHGGISKMNEAGVTLLGGHTVDDAELKYGLSVTGTVHPKRLVSNSGARAGDRLILTKPLGTGIISTALKAGQAGEDTAAKVTRSMASLNKAASEAMQEIGAHACTDITGFGLLGHACQVAQHSQVGIKLHLQSVPLFIEAEDFARRGLCPGGLYRNREFYSPMVDFSGSVPDYSKDILFDAQTSGGLLIALEPAAAESLMHRLKEGGVPDAAIIGEVVGKPVGKVLVE